MSPCSEFQHVEPFLYVIESTENEPEILDVTISYYQLGAVFERFRYCKTF